MHELAVLYKQQAKYQEAEELLLEAGISIQRTERLCKEIRRQENDAIDFHNAAAIILVWAGTKQPFTG